MQRLQPVARFRQTHAVVQVPATELLDASGTNGWLRERFHHSNEVSSQLTSC